ncbi:MAG: PTS sugar transporter subunit IIA [Marinibacterium sp.]|nr:PTS sugar transporter subunit IIA [Marinibacterium sp.]
MDLTSILKPEAVKVLSAVSSKKRLFQDIGELAFAAYGLTPARTVEALLERESLGPTGVGHGVALPHTRMPALDGVLGVFVALEKPIDFGSVDRQPVDLAFALFAPEDGGVDHLKALALVSRTLREPDLCAKLRSNLDASKLYTILTESRTVKAA